MVYRYVALGRTVAMKDPRHSQFSTRQYQSLTRDGQQVTLAHDPDGNQARGPLPMDVPGTTSQMTWDAENRLKTVTTSAGDLITHHYAPGSGRIAREHNGKVSLWLYQGWNPVAEYRGSTAAIATPVHLWTWGQDLSGTRQGAGGVGGLLAETRPASSSANSGATAISYYPTHDANGNITQYLGATSTPAAHYEYTAFGQSKVATGPQAQTFAHQFSTKQKDALTGLLYYGYRFYDPLTGRWPSRDPIGELGGINFYGMLGNNTLHRVDLLGLSSRGEVNRAANEAAKRNAERNARKPDGHEGFHHYGNWGGPGWANGEWRYEVDPLPPPDDPNYEPPKDDRDACYEAHDRCISACPKPSDWKPCSSRNRGAANENGNRKRKARAASSNCIKQCDHELAQCLRDTGNRGLESFAFDTLIPWIVH